MSRKPTGNQEDKATASRAQTNGNKSAPTGAPSIVDAITNAIVDIMAETDFQKITVRDVVKRAGIARSSFYRYFDSVEDAVLQMEDEFFAEIDRINSLSLQALSLHEGPSGATSSQVQRFDYFRARSDFILATDGPHGDPAFRLRAQRIFADYYAQRMRNKGISSEKLHLYTVFAAAGHYAMVRSWLCEHPEISSLEMAEMTNRLFYTTPSL